MKLSEANFGDRVQDQITEFVGICTGKVEYISGCNQLLLSPPAKDGDLKDAHWFDVDRCTVIEPGAIALVVETPGFDKEAPVR